MYQAIVIALSFIVFATGCALDSRVSDGRRLMDMGQTAEGLAMLEKTSRDNPTKADLRMEWLRAREQATAPLIANADAARLSGQLDAAKALYERALRFDGQHPAVTAGLAALRAAERHRAVLHEAESLLRQNDLAAAETKARDILLENPTHPGARNLLRRVVDAMASRSVAPPVLRAAMGKQITLEFSDANIRSVFDVISRTAGINFVFDKDVRPDLRTTITVRNSTLDEVIRLILISNQLERKVLNENTLLIYPNTPAKLKDYQDLIVRSFYIANADVKQMLTMIKTVIKTRDVYIDEKLNHLVMRDTAEAVRLAEKLIATQDMPEPEVSLEVEVLELASSRLQELGARFPDRISFQDPATIGAALGVMRASGPLTAFITTPAAILNLKQQDGYTNVLANPRIRVRHREKAKIHIGDKVPVVTTTSTANVGVSASVNYLDVGLKLDVEPNIYLDGDVAIRVGLEVSNIVREIPISGGGIAYQVGTRSASTMLRLKDGETQVLAGLISDEDRVNANKVPGLGELPVVGRLFSNNNTTRTKTEIVLLITPRIVRGMERPEFAVAEVFSGTESAVGSAPLTMTGTAAVTGMAASPGPIRIELSGETKAAPNSEFSVMLDFPSDARAKEAHADVVFDPTILEPAAGARPVGTGKGRVRVNLIHGEGSQRSIRTPVVFKIIGVKPVRTEIRVDKLTVVDRQGRELPASLPPGFVVNVE